MNALLKDWGHYHVWHIETKGSGSKQVMGRAVIVPGRIDIVSVVELNLYEDEPKKGGLTTLKRKIGEG